MGYNLRQESEVDGVSHGAKERTAFAVAVLLAMMLAGVAGFAVGRHWPQASADDDGVHGNEAAPIETLRNEYLRLAEDYRRELALLEARRTEIDAGTAERELFAEVQATLARSSSELSRREVDVLRERVAYLQDLVARARSAGYIPTVTLPPRPPRARLLAEPEGPAEITAVEEPAVEVNPEPLGEHRAGETYVPPQHPRRKLVPPPPMPARESPAPNKDEAEEKTP